MVESVKLLNGLNIKKGEPMRVMIYNIAYGTGAPSSYTDAVIKSHRALKRSSNQFDLLKQFIVDSKPDVIGLIEIDRGSYRTAFSCQATAVAKALSYEVHSASKYKHKLFRHVLPILRKQGNAILTRKGLKGNFHFFSRGVKRLIIELDCDVCRFFLVHLALSKHARQAQVAQLIELIGSSDNRPIVIGGDFNTFKGIKELKALIKEFNLKNANIDNVPTFPSWEPKQQLDYILHSPQLKLKHFYVPDVKLSDHLPLIADFEL